MQVFDSIIIGGGAAGLMCAATAGARGKTVAVLDHSNKVGKKILMSGGGRCNFTNYFVEPTNYLSKNPHFCKSALARYTPYDFLELVGRHQLAWHEKTLGQLFCDIKSQDILDILLRECDQAGAEVHTHCRVESITPTDKNGLRFILDTSRGIIGCSSLVVATGGLSIPTMGATGFGYDIAKQFGLKVTAKAAALVPFTFKGELLALAQSLAGVALPVNIECTQQGFKEALLFTHKGISGPAVLQISNYWYPGDSLSIDFLPDLNITQLIHNWQQGGHKSQLGNLLAQHLPKRFVNTWLEYHQVQILADKTVFDLSTKEIELLQTLFNQWHLIPAGTEGYRTAEVTRGGVDTDEISSKTFEAKKVPGLYFIGEVLDVTGWLGGFNFQWAWASGYCAGQSV
ncbi:MAG TPA: NAD(P)/FAD-dependent oxidoreductase [Cellvibrionaceae bacterium]